MDLAKDHPQEYPKGTPPLPDDEARALASEVSRWTVEGRKLIKTLQFKNFNEAFGFVSRIALLAESEGHHPDITISWNVVDLAFWTHTAEGLTRNDFIMAAKVDRLSP